MTYRTHVAVIRAIPEELMSGLIPESERDSWDAVACTFGINASSASEAVNLAVSAARNAVDRDGDFIGGIVVEALCRYANREEFNGYEKYFHNPSDRTGIFYVSGVTYYVIPKDKVVDAGVELEAMKENIKQFGLPTPSFIHPKWQEGPPKRVRMLCAVCGHWVEVDNFGLICSFMTGLNESDPEYQDAKKAREVAGPFMRRHHSHSSSIVGIQEDDERWGTLSEEFREDDDTV